MLRAEATIERVYLYHDPVDMRKQRNGLAALVQEVIRADPFPRGGLRVHGEAAGSLEGPHLQPQRFHSLVQGDRRR